MNLGELNSDDCLRKKIGRLQQSSDTVNLLASAEDISMSGKNTPAQFGLQSIL